MIGLVGSDKEKNKKIGALSKGYKQLIGWYQVHFYCNKVYNCRVLFFSCFVLNKPHTF
jgi:hypothetical protein